MRKDELIVKVVTELRDLYPEIDIGVVRGLLERELYNYDLQPISTALVPASDIYDRIGLFLASKKLDGLSDLTLKGYKQRLIRFACSIPKNVEDINTMDIRMRLANYSRSGVKNTTLSTETSTLKSFFGWLENEEYITKSPMRKIKNIKVEKRLRKALTIEEVELMRDACKTYRERAVLEFLYSTGCRLDEVVKTNKVDINWQTMSLKVIGKGNKERTVYLNSKAKVQIQKYLMTRLDDCQALFVTERKPHDRLGRRAIEREIAKIGSQADLGKSVYPHLIRHTMATALLNNGADLATVQKILGHDNPSTTQLYAQLNDEIVQHQYKKHMVN